jgi:quercetin dioxygenase-like cupin family protein
MVNRVVDSAREKPLAFDWGTIRWLVSEGQIADSQLTFGLAEIQPGMGNPAHYHPNCDEVLYMLEGEIDHWLGEDSVHLGPGMALHIPTGLVHHAVNRGPGVARMALAYSSGDRQVVMLEGTQY